jgi:hypothetical protein
LIHSSRRDRKTRAIAEVLAMIIDADPKLAPQRPRPELAALHALDRAKRMVRDGHDLPLYHLARFYVAT